MKTILSKSLLALALAAASSVAFASQLYHVTIDTSTLGSGSAYLDLGLATLADSAPSTATLSHFQGAYGSDTSFGGSGSGTVASGGTVVLKSGSDNYSDLLQDITLGGKFSFDFSLDTMGSGNTSSFLAYLYNSTVTGYLGMQGALLEVDVTPGQADIVSAANAYASVAPAAVSAVPEPSTLLSMVTGLGLLGFGLRRRAR